MGCGLTSNCVCFNRFVRFVSTPEILERVYTIESEILQIGEAIAIQGNNDMGLSTVSVIYQNFCVQHSTRTFSFYFLFICGRWKNIKRNLWEAVKVITKWEKS